MKFSIRELLSVTVIVALMLGWGLRERHFASALTRANRWRNGAGALEDILKSDGAEVKWHFEAEEPEVDYVLSGKKRDYFFRSGSHRLESFEPSDDAPAEDVPNSPAPAANPPKE